jgi:hypothetical protein
MKEDNEEHKSDSIEIHFRSLKTGEKVSFKVSKSSMLENAWDQANSLLSETRSPEDNLRCAGGADMTEHLHKSVSLIREDKICVNLHFEIKGPSGGADD